jgi:hypothetical protein
VDETKTRNKTEANISENKLEVDRQVFKRAKVPISKNIMVLVQACKTYLKALKHV